MLELLETLGLLSAFLKVTCHQQENKKYNSLFTS